MTRLRSTRVQHAVDDVVLHRRDRHGLPPINTFATQPPPHVAGQTQAQQRLSARNVLSLQRTIGNRAFQRSVIGDGVSTLQRDDDEDSFWGDVTNSVADFGGGAADWVADTTGGVAESAAETTGGAVGSIVESTGEAVSAGVEAIGSVEDTVDSSMVTNDIVDAGAPVSDAPPGGADPVADPDESSDSDDKEIGNIRFTLATDKATDDDVGHAWVIAEEPGKSPDSWGFWPATTISTPGQLANHWGGQVRHPDTSHQPTATITALVNDKQLDRGLAYAEEKRDAIYSLLVYNCTHFARRMWTLVTGTDAPSGGWFVDDPKDLHKSILKDNKERGLDANQRPLPPEEV